VVAWPAIDSPSAWNCKNRQRRAIPQIRHDRQSAHAEKLFAGSGHTFKEIVDQLNTEKALPHFPLAITIRAKTGVKRSSAQSLNLVGLLPGSDPKLKDEYVVISAHLDHLGIGEPVNGDNIYNGAMDDASGIASVIEIANAMHASGAKPKRSILFLAVTAEEKGLLGSEYFATHPTVQGTIVADLNMDMYLPLFPLKFLEVQGLGESTLGDDVTSVAIDAGVTVQADKQRPDMFASFAAINMASSRLVCLRSPSFGWLRCSRRKTIQRLAKTATTA
jgi:hypothetical protein